MIGRRGFLGALVGLPIAAAAANVTPPEVTAPAFTTTAGGGGAHYYAAQFVASGVMTPTEVRRREDLPTLVDIDREIKRSIFNEMQRGVRVKADL